MDQTDSVLSSSHLSNTLKTSTSRRKPQPSLSKTFVHETSSGSIGGMLGIVVGQPLDTIRVRIQTQHGVYKNSMDCFHKTLQKEKIQGLFKGMLSPLLAEAANNVILFGVYGIMKPFHETYFKENCNPANYSFAKEFSAICFSGALSGALMTTILAPSELIKIQLQTNTDEVGKQVAGKRGFLDCVSHLYKTGFSSAYNAAKETTSNASRARLKGVFGGIAHLYRGYSVTLVREVPYTALYFAIYEYTKRYLKQQTPTSRCSEDELNPMCILIAGGLAGSIAWLATYPQDMIKSVVQADYQQKSATQVLRNILKHEGFFGLWRGVSPTILRAFLVNAATFLGYEYTMRLHHSSFNLAERI